MRPVTFTDISSLRTLERDSPQQLRAVAQQFESMFVDMMLQAARSATAVLAAGDPFQSNETALHQEMLDHQLAIDMSQHGGIGLQPLLVRQLSKIVPGAHAAAAASAADAAHTPAQRSAPPALGADGRIVRPLTGVPLHPAAAGFGISPPHREIKSLPVRPQHPPSSALRGADAKQQAFASPLEFVRSVLPAIEKVTAGTPVSALAVLAQAALETGWGSAVIGDGKGGSSFNLFGIKSSSEWQGPSATVDTLEVRNGAAQREQAAFRVYGSVEQSVGDLLAKLQGSPIYAKALAVANDPAAYAREIASSGYATDPAYANKLLRVLDSPTLAAALQVITQERLNGAGNFAPSAASGAVTGTLQRSDAPADATSSLSKPPARDEKAR